MMTVEHLHSEQKSRGRELLEEKALNSAIKCIQCGYCLPACPTYESMGKESASPRGRISLVKLAAEGKVDVLRDLAEPLELCLGCRACEPACPVQVPYGRILETAKEAIANERKWGSSPLVERIKTGLFKHLFPYPRRLRTAGNLLWLSQKIRLDQFLGKTGLLRKWAPAFSQLSKSLPRIESPSKRIRWGDVFPAEGQKKGRVAFFAGCIMDGVFHGINRLTIDLLRKVGCEVIVPKKQNCCGALHAHQGLTEWARRMAKANILAFEATGADVYVNNAGGCGAMLREYDHLFHDEPKWRLRAARFVRKTKDVSELLLQYGPPPYVTRWEGRITYQESCHLRNVQKVKQEPRELLRSIPGAVLVEMEGSDRCCGSGGIYNLLHFDDSMDILDSKMKQVARTGATTIVTTNPGCQLQMRLGVERMGKSDQIRVLHLAELLAEVCL